MKKMGDFSIDIQKLCEIKGPLHVYFLDVNNKFVACNKLKADFCRDILGQQDIIGKSPHDLLNGDAIATIESCYLENTDILKDGLPRQFYNVWDVKGRYKLELLTIKMPIYNSKGKPLGVLGISHFINKFSMEKAKELGFTKRETEVLYYLFEGYTAKEVGRAIKLSPRTVEGYIKNMKIRVNCSTISELLITAAEKEVRQATGEMVPINCSLVKKKASLGNINSDAKASVATYTSFY